MEDLVNKICLDFPSPTSRTTLCLRCKDLLSSENKLEALTEDSIPALCHFSDLEAHCSLCQLFERVSLASNPNCDNQSMRQHRLRVLLNTDMKDSESGDQVLSDVAAPLGLMVECKIPNHETYGGITALDFLTVPDTSLNALNFQSKHTTAFDPLPPCYGLYSQPDYWASSDFSQPITALINACRTGHANCGSKGLPVLPSLVIDLARLSSTQRVFLCAQTTGPPHKLADYVALSYCWGGPQELLTTKANLTEHSQDGISFSRLPRTIAEAVMVSSHLGIPYLWVDALCIVQDDLDNKAKEIENMADIYTNATLVIVASGTVRSVHDSFLDTFSSVAVVPLYNSIVGQTVPVCVVRADLEHIDSRAWTFQERHLASRVMEFGSPEGVLFSCKKTQYRFTGIEWKEGRSQRQGTITLDNWKNVVQEYSMRDLTFAGDRLNALASFAKQFRSSRDDDVYLAGLWKSTLMDDLMWTLGTGMRMRLPLHKYVSPGWSWTSVMDRKDHAGGGRNFEKVALAYKHIEWYGGHDEDAALLLGHDIKLAHPSAPYGSVVSGSITLSATTMEFQRFNASDKVGMTTVEHSFQYELSDEEMDRATLMLLKRAARWDVDSSSTGHQQALYGHGGLLLLPTDDTQLGKSTSTGKMNTFRRVGTFWHWTPAIAMDESDEFEPMWHPYWDSEEPRDITIV